MIGTGNNSTSGNIHRDVRRQRGADRVADGEAREALTALQPGETPPDRDAKYFDIGVGKSSIPLGNTRAGDDLTQCDMSGVVPAF
jgi:hypothetical protein